MRYLQGYRINGDFQEEYLNNIPALKYLREFTFKKPVTFLVGENGSGKSTLLEALAVQYGFNPEGGTRNMTFSTRESHSSLYSHITPIRGVPFAKDGFFLRAESYYNVSTDLDRLAGIVPGDEGFMERNYGGASMHEQSHGESFMALAMNRFRKQSIFFLDEPEAALSPIRQMSLMALIHDLVGKDCQFIIATHSPIITAYPEAEIIELSFDGAGVVTYKETELYTTTKRFLDNPDAMIRHLLDN